MNGGHVFASQTFQRLFNMVARDLVQIWRKLLEGACESGQRFRAIAVKGGRKAREFFVQRSGMHGVGRFAGVEKAEREQPDGAEVRRCAVLVLKA